MKDLPKLAIDCGSGITKWRRGNDYGDFPSVAGAVPDGAFSVKDFSDDVVMFNKHSFLTGESANAILDASERCSTLSRDWARSNAYRALFYRALAAAFPGGFSGRVALCAGLPQAVFDEIRKDFQNRISGQHEFWVGKRKYEIEVDSRDFWLIPQSMAIFFSAATENPELLDDLVGVIDVGTFTSGYSMINRSIFNPRKSNGIELGLANLKDELGSYICREHGVQLPPSIATDALIRGHVRVKGKRFGLKSIIPNLVDPLMDRLVRELKTAWGDDSAAASILVAGGGAPWVLKSLRRQWPHADLAGDTDTCYRVIVDGYMSYLEDQYDG